MVLQGCGWHDLGFNKKEPFDPVRGRRPNWQETHFMAYDAHPARRHRRSLLGLQPHRTG